VIATIRSPPPRLRPDRHGDTKVVGRGNGDKDLHQHLGHRPVPPGVDLSSLRVRPGDAILLSGPVGDHGATIKAAREGLESARAAQRHGGAARAGRRP
jgi:hydrogenase maturation factor